MAELKTIKDSIIQILTDLNAMKNSNGYPIWNYVAIWNNQLKRSFDGSGYNFLFPAVFVEIEDFNSEDWGLGVSIQDLNIIFHICHQELDATDGTLDQNLQVFDYRTKIRQYFSSYSNAPTFNTFMFKKEVEDFNHGNVSHWKEIFKTRYCDLSGSPYFNGTYKIIPGGSWTTNWEVEITSP